MELEGEVLERVRTYESQSRWERAELGRELRLLGLSYGEIMELIPVKKSTLATWCRDVELTEEQLREIGVRRTPVPGKTLAGYRYTTQRPRKFEIELIRSQAKLEAHHLSRDPFWMAGVVLYWGEGSKTNRQLGLANSDPSALRLFKNGVNNSLDRTMGGELVSTCTPTTMSRQPGPGGQQNSTFLWMTSPSHISSPTGPDTERTISNSVCAR